MSRVPHQASARLPGPGYPMLSSQMPGPSDTLPSKPPALLGLGSAGKCPAQAPPGFAKFQPFTEKGPQRGARGKFLPSPLSPRPPESGEKGASSL